MRFLADMGVSRRVTAWLQEQGHDVVHLRTEGLQRLPNGQIFRKAMNEKRIVLTFDLDFGEIVAQSQGQPVSVILFRLHNATSPFVIRRLQTILPAMEEALQSGAVVVVQDGRFRIRRLPMES